MGLLERRAEELATLRTKIKEIQTLQTETLNASGRSRAAKKRKLGRLIADLDAWRVKGPEAKQAQREALDAADVFLIALDTDQLGDIIDDIDDAASLLEEPTAAAIQNAESLFFPMVDDAVGKMSTAVVKIEAAVSALDAALDAAEAGTGSNKDAALAEKAVKEAIDALSILVVVPGDAEA
ncbi:MAG: hypothetical protein WBS20_18045 [Lysobacterales bacterium]